MARSGGSLVHKGPKWAASAPVALLESARIEKGCDLPQASRRLFQASLILFVITVVIGILNGLDIWEPPHGALITHVHAGTLGWITLAVFGGAIWMRDGADGAEPLATYSVIAIAAYVLAFWSVDLTSPTTIQRPIGGTLAFIAIGWMLVWYFRGQRGAWTVAQLGMGLALTFLTLGAILGVLLGLQLADVNVVGEANTEALGGAHPATMVIGFVILAALAIAEWRLQGDAGRTLGEDKLGVTQMLLVFLAGFLGMLGLLFEVTPLIIANVPFEVVGILIVLWRLRRHLAPSTWSPDANRFVRTAVLGLIPTVALTAMVVQNFAGGADFTEFEHILIALDHTTFLLVATMLILSMMIAGSVVAETTVGVIYYGVLVGASGFIVALLAQSAVLKRIFTPILGLTLLYAIFTLLSAEDRQRVGSDSLGTGAQ